MPGLFQTNSSLPKQRPFSGALSTEDYLSVLMKAGSFKRRHSRIMPIFKEFAISLLEEAPVSSFSSYEGNGDVEDSSRVLILGRIQAIHDSAYAGVNDPVEVAESWRNALEQYAPMCNAELLDVLRQVRKTMEDLMKK
jgi:hypothetical protein